MSRPPTGVVGNGVGCLVLLRSPFHRGRRWVRRVSGRPVGLVGDRRGRCPANHAVRCSNPCRSQKRCPGRGSSPGGIFFPCRTRSELDDVGGLLPLGTTHDFELDLLTLCQRSEAGALNGGSPPLGGAILIWQNSGAWSEGRRSRCGQTQLSGEAP